MLSIIIYSRTAGICESFPEPLCVLFCLLERFVVHGLTLLMLRCVSPKILFIFEESAGKFKFRLMLCRTDLSCIYRIMLTTAVTYGKRLNNDFKFDPKLYSNFCIFEDSQHFPSISYTFCPLIGF